jgi:hypothetical protein
MYTFELNIGSLLNPVKGGGYIQVQPLTDGNGFTKKRDDKFFAIVRTEFSKNLMFKQDEFRALKELSDNEETSVEMKVYYNGSERWYGYLLLSGKFDEDRITCELETQPIDQYSILHENLDNELNVIGYANGTATLQYTAYVFTLTLPCFTGSRGEAEFYYDPNGEVSDNPLDSHVDWALYAEAGEIDCGGGQKQYIYKTAVLPFAASGFTQSVLTPSLWLSPSTVNITVLITLTKVAKLYDILERFLELIDTDITISESTYSDYINNSANLINNLKIMDKSDAKRNEATGATFEMIKLKEMLELYKDWFDLSYNLDADKNFTFKKRGDFTEIDYETHPSHYLTTYKDTDFTENQKKYAFSIDQVANKMIINFEKCGRAWFDKAELIFDSFAEKEDEKTYSRFNNNIDYLRTDPEDVADNGFCVLSCNSGGVVRSQDTLNGSDLTNGGMSAHLLIYNHWLDNRLFSSAQIVNSGGNLKFDVDCTKGKYKEVQYKNMAIYDIDDIDFDYYVKTNLGLGEPQELSVKFDNTFGTLKVTV